MTWTELDFGKYEGLTLPQILFKDPDWFFWAVATDVFKTRPRLRSESNALYQKSRRIKVPQAGSEELVAEYWVNESNMFTRFVLVPVNRRNHFGSGGTTRLGVIDMSFPWRKAPYDKRGCRSMLSALKHYLFGGTNVRMTKRRCEDFFDEPRNFV